MSAGLSTPMTEGQKAKWKALRAKGPLWFVFRYDILTAGLAFATLTTLTDYFGLFGVAHWLGAKGEIFHFIFRTLFFGIVMGWWAWHTGEKRFHSAMIEGRRRPREEH